MEGLQATASFYFILSPVDKQSQATDWTYRKNTYWRWERPGRKQTVSCIFLTIHALICPAIVTSKKSGRIVSWNSQLDTSFELSIFSTVLYPHATFRLRIHIFITDKITYLTLYRKPFPALCSVGKAWNSRGIFWCVADWSLVGIGPLYCRTVSSLAVFRTCA